MDSKITLNFESIGTKWVVDIYDDLIEGNNLENEISKIIFDFSKIFSRFDPSSKISKSSKNAAKIIIPKAYIELVDFYKRLYKITDGKFTPLIGNLLEDAGYNKDYSLKPKTLRPVPSWESTLNFNGEILEIKNPVTLDFGAAGKGFLIDLVSSLFQKQNLQNYCIDAGGDILYKTVNGSPLRIGLENPDNFKQVIGVSEIKNQSICGSAGNRRRWGNHHHIFDPKKLESVQEVKAVWVIADKAYIADGLSTALFFTEPFVLEKNFNFDYLIIYADNQFKKSENFPGQIFFERSEKI